MLAPPISSGDEDSSEEDGRDPVADAEKGGKSPISSGNESPDRADIRPTTFPSSWNSTTSTASNRSRIQYGSSQKGVKRYGLARSSQESKPSSSQRSRNEKEPRDGLDPVKGDSLLRDPDRTFKKGNGAKPSSPRASRQKRTKKAATGKESSPFHTGLVVLPCYLLDRCRTGAVIDAAKDNLARRPPQPRKKFKGRLRTGYPCRDRGYAVAREAAAVVAGSVEVTFCPRGRGESRHEIPWPLG